MVQSCSFECLRHAGVSSLLKKSHSVISANPSSLILGLRASRLYRPLSTRDFSEATGDGLTRKGGSSPEHRTSPGALGESFRVALGWPGLSRRFFFGSSFPVGGESPPGKAVPVPEGDRDRVPVGDRRLGEVESASAAVAVSGGDPRVGWRIRVFAPAPVFPNLPTQSSFGSLGWVWSLSVFPYPR